MSLHSLFQLPLPVLALLSLTPLAHCNCYIASYGLVSEQSWIACPGTATSPGGVQTCCMSGSECGEDSICHTPSASASEKWYLAGCTDPNYQASVCNNACGAYATLYIEYENSSKEWMCCGNGGCNGTVTVATFKAVSPQDWRLISGSSAPSNVAPAQTSTQRSTAVTASPATSSSNETTSGNAATTGATTKASREASAQVTRDATTKATTQRLLPTTGTYDFTPSQIQTGRTTAVATISGADTSNQHQNNNGGGLSTGAQAGIGVGIGLSALALTVGLVAIFMLRRNRKSKEANLYAAGDDVREKREALPPYPPSSSDRSVDGHPSSRMSELPTNPPVYEVGGRENEVPNRSWR